MSFKKLFFRNLFISGGFTYLAQLVLFVSSFVTSRLLTPEDFGLVGLIAVFSGFINIFSDSGLSMAVIRSDYKDTYYRGLNFLSLIIGAGLCICTLILIYPISIFYSNENIILPGIAIAFLFILKSLSIVPIAIIQKQLRFAVSGKILFFSTLAGTICTIIMAWAGLSYWSLIWSQYVTALISFALTYTLMPHLYRKTITATIKKSFLLARKLIGNLIGFNTINYWSRNTDNLIVGKYFGTVDLGIYNRAYMMLQMPLNLITGLFSSVLLPSFVKLKNENGNIEQEYYFILKIISLINIPIALILILFPELLVNTLWGARWISVAKLLPYFGLLVLTQTLTSTLGNLLVVQKEEKTLMYSGWISAALMIIGIVFGSFFSVTGIAAFYALAYIILVLPFTLIYVFIKRLNFVEISLTFWIPKIFLSLLIWLAIYYNFYTILVYTLIAWVMFAVWQMRKELSILKTKYLKINSF